MYDINTPFWQLTVGDFTDILSLNKQPIVLPNGMRYIFIRIIYLNF